MQVTKFERHDLINTMGFMKKSSRGSATTISLSRILVKHFRPAATVFLPNSARYKDDFFPRSPVPTHTNFILAVKDVDETQEKLRMTIPRFPWVISRA